jgi:hypothetical protein
MIHIAAKRKRGAMRKLHPWDAAQSTVLIRHDAETVQDTQLEPGVNFFVLMLEQLGATTRFSCEGHPDGFYVVFESSPELARSIAHAGFFTVEIWEGEADYAMRISEHLFERYVGPWNDPARKEHLRLAAARWVERFGSLREGASTN